ncbi:PREDICTED: centriolin [Nanorana parkeri]|uniref:centriolin n=1 Tax=Nanorana parkeri TaxID=125878 RepID=UPI000854AC99|nr:PREDICTED: centriolin [Nanorana parkeri]
MKPQNSASYPRGGVISHNLDMTEDSEISEYEMHQGHEPGIRYITENLIHKLSKQENLAFVTALNLCLSKEGGKKFKYIENLEKCEKLEVLNLSYNLLERIEKLEKQSRLRELNLSQNRISKIEGLEHMYNLQKLNLAGNEIEHIPVWFGKKIKALNTLNLKQNKIFSLQDVSRLKTLKDLTSLFLADNPIANLPHYRLFIIFHLRSLNVLDGQPITNQERQEAHERFNMEEVEKLEKDMEKKMKEIEELQGQKAKVLNELHHQDELNKSLRQEAQQHKKNSKELEREMDTKKELLKQKTLELTRACQKQYELEQELAFYKIDAKFEPLGYLTSEEMDAEVTPDESPYIGKARYKRNLYAQEGFIPDRAQHIQMGKIEADGDDQIKNQQIRARIHTTLDVDLNEKEKTIQTAQAKLSELQQEIVNSEQQILKATEELKELEDAVAQRKIVETEKEKLRQQLSQKIQLLNELRQEAQELERQMDRQRREMDKKYAELEELQRHLDSLSPHDPQHAHVQAQKASKEQQLEMMDRQYKQLEGRLDEMLSRIARETEEIKDLEQQLTEGQIAANEALKRDLEGIISGLQEYLDSVKGQAKQAHEECRELQSEREVLLQRLEELEEERERLEAAAQDTEDLKKEIEELERTLQEQQDLNESLRQAQGNLSEYEAQLEEQLGAREAEIEQLKQELERRKRQGHAESSALKAELQRDRHALENALTKAQMLEEKDKDGKKLSSQLQQLQRENESLKKQLERVQAQLTDALQNMVHPDQITGRVSELKRKLQTGVGEVRSSGPSDILGQNLAELQQQINDILEKAEEEKREANKRQKKLQEEIPALQEKAKEAPWEYKKACNKAAEARIQQEKRQCEARVRQLEREVHQLNDKLKTMEEIQGLADQQLVEADEERERLLTALHDLQSEKKMEDVRAQKQLSGLENELRELKKAVAMSDKVATSELTDAKHQLRSLHGTVLQINQDRAEKMREAENFCSQTAQAARDLSKAEAEIDLLQELLQVKERQLREEVQNLDAGATISTSQQLEIDKLNQTLRRQRAEIERLRHMLDHVRVDNAEEIDNLLDEIDSLRNALGYQNDYITGMTDPFRRRGYWYYVPSSSNNSGRDSISTKDSGVSLHYPLTSSPARWKDGHHRHIKKEKLSTPGMGHWVYSPFRHGHHRCHRDDEVDGGSRSDSDTSPCRFVPPPGSVIYTVFPDGSPVPQGTVIYGPAPPSTGRSVAPGTVVYGPPPAGSHFVYGPPPPQFTIPVIPAGVLHCNVSAHHNLENEVARLEDIIDHLKSRRQREKRAKVRLTDDIKELERRKQMLRREVEDLHNTTQKHKRKNFTEGHLDNLITELELERSLQHHDSIGDEIDCIEKTLVKRRAELRQADRLLAEAENELKDTQEKTADLIEKYSTAKKHLSQTENDAEELERRAQETAVNLVKADQQLRILQTNARDLEQHRAEQENILQEINSVVSSKDNEFQSLNHKIQTMADSLLKLQDDIQVAEGKEDHHLQILKEAENLLLEKKIILERLNSQISLQQDEITELDRVLGQKKEELNLLQDQIEIKMGDLKEVLRRGEQEAAEKRREIKEVKSLLDDLSVEKGELSAQLNEKRLHLSNLKQEVMQEEDNLQKRTSQIHKQKTELKHVLEMQQLETNELRGLKMQHDQKINDLEKTQPLLLQGKLELENLQRMLQRLNGEVDWKKQLLEKDHQEIELLMTQMHTLQEKVEILSGEKEQLEESRDDLERKLAHTKKALADTEASARTASGTLDKLESDIKSLQSELSQLSKQKESFRQETTAAQQTLQEKSGEVKLLQDELTALRDQLRVVEQDLRNTTKQRDDMLCEQSTLQNDISESTRQYRLLQDKESKKEQHLKQMLRAIECKECEIKQQETHLKQIMKDIEHQEEKLRASAARLEDQRHTYEQEILNQQNALDRINAKVLALEEHTRKMQEEKRWCGDLEESLATARHLLSEHDEQLRDKTNEILSLQKEAEIYRKELSSLRKQLLSEKKNDENRILMLKEAITNQRLQFEQSAEEQKLESSSLKKQLLAAEQAAYDNHERAKRLLKELKQLQAEHAILRKQLKSQEELDKRQQEVNEAVKELKAQVKREIQSTLQDLQCSAKDDLEEDAEAILEHNQSVRSELESLKENFPFTANSTSEPPLAGKLGSSQSQLTEEHWRGEALREKLRQQEDRLKAQLHQQMCKQADVLSRGRQQTEGSLFSLRRQVNALDELVSNISADSSFHSQNSSSATPFLSEETRSLNFRASTSPIPVTRLAGTQSLFRECCDALQTLDTKAANRLACCLLHHRISSLIK